LQPTFEINIFLSSPPLPWKQYFCAAHLCHGEYFWAHFAFAWKITWKNAGEEEEKSRHWSSHLDPDLGSCAHTLFSEFPTTVILIRLVHSLCQRSPVFAMIQIPAASPMANPHHDLYLGNLRSWYRDPDLEAKSLTLSVASHASKSWFRQLHSLFSVEKKSSHRPKLGKSYILEFPAYDPDPDNFTLTLALVFWA
jgi:hypothetical protein